MRGFLLLPIVVQMLCSSYSLHLDDIANRKITSNVGHTNSLLSTLLSRYLLATKQIHTRKRSNDGKPVDENTFHLPSALNSEENAKDTASITDANYSDYYDDESENVNSSKLTIKYENNSINNASKLGDTEVLEGEQIIAIKYENNSMSSTSNGKSATDSDELHKGHKMTVKYKTENFEESGKLQKVGLVMSTELKLSVKETETTQKVEHSSKLPCNCSCIVKSNETHILEKILEVESLKNASLFTRIQYRVTHSKDSVWATVVVTVIVIAIILGTVTSRMWRDYHGAVATGPKYEQYDHKQEILVPDLFRSRYLKLKTLMKKKPYPECVDKCPLEMQPFIEEDDDSDSEETVFTV